MVTVPPPAADFSIAVPGTAVSLTQGTSSAGISISVAARNGFNGTVQVTLDGVPAGVSANPASPFAVSAGGNASVIFTASASAATGNFTITADGTSGALSHSANIGLTVAKATASNLPRSTYVRTDAMAAMDDPFGEPKHRHLIYDPTNKHVFVANRAMNQVEVLSSSDGSRVKSISLAGASSVDLSADGKSVVVGTALEEIARIDATSLQVTDKWELAGIAAVPGAIFARPIEVLATANGLGLVRLRQASTSQALLALWDAGTNSLTDLTSEAPQLFQNGVGVMARSGDHARILVAADDSSGEVGIFDASGNLAVGPKPLGSGQILRAAANADGTRYAVAFRSNGNVNVILLDGSLNTVSMYASSNVFGLAFTRDGKNALVSEAFGGVSAVTVLAASDGSLVGEVADLWIQGVGSEIEEADETQMVFGLSNRGVSFVDAATPGTLSGAGPVLAAIPSVAPSEGPVAGGTAVAATGQNFSGDVQVKFGGLIANSTSISGASISASSPANAAGGPVNASAYFSSGWMVTAPDAFSYGPQILQVFPNAGVKSGGDTLQVLGYGFGSDVSKIAVKIGGANATVTKVESVATIGSALGFDNSYPFPLERITLQTPVGTAGKADLIVNAPAGSTTMAKSFQYLQSVQMYARTGPFKFLVYDQTRQRIYLSGTDHVDVFDLQQGVYLPALFPPGGPPPNAGFRGMALTPDSSKLIVADFGGQSVYLLDPQSGNGTKVVVGGVAGFLNSGPSRVAATSTETVFVGLSGEGGSSGSCSACLAQMNLSSSPVTIQPAPQPEVTSLTGAPLLQSNATGDRVFLTFGTAAGGPLAIWDANSPNKFTTSAMKALTSDVGVNADGTMFTIQANGATEIHSEDLALHSVPVMSELAQIPGRAAVPGVAMHPSGALVYQPFLTGAPGSSGVKGGVDILDAHSGVLRIRIFLPQQLLTDVDGLHGSFLATDETGQRIFTLTSPDGLIQNNSLTIVQLASVPLGIGTVNPAQVGAGGGTVLTIRGSGFIAGISVTIAGKSTTATFKDASTLSVIAPVLSVGAQTVVVKNPDGETVSLDAALVAN